MSDFADHHQDTASDASTLLDKLDRVRAAMSAALAGHELLIERLLIAIITGGHVLIEGSPGLAKTRTVNRFSRLVRADFARIQATPDLLPADITGTSIYQQNTGNFSFIRGPLFNNIVLVDEINRAPPKVQSALLEAMAEQQITTSGQTYPLHDPFMVVATQNPIEHEGTYPLPEAQLDRFLFFLHIALPDPNLERSILDLVLAEASVDAGGADEAIIDAGDITAARRLVNAVFLSDAVRDYIVRLVTATRGYGAAGEQLNEIEHAASPRASIFLARAAQARAWMDGRDHTTPDDVQALAVDVLSGRLVLSYHALASGINSRDIVQRILDQAAVV